MNKNISLNFLTELEMGTENVVEMQENQTILHNPVSMDKMEKCVNKFNFLVFNLKSFLLSF